MTSKGKVCPVTDERCHYLECLRSEGCLREAPDEAAPPFQYMREPSLKRAANG